MKILLVLGILTVMGLQVNSSDEPLFAADLYKAINTNGNLVFSPYSIQACLGLAYMGAAGETAKELAEGLRFGSMTKAEVANQFASVLQANNDVSNQMKIANKIFLNIGYEVSDAFKSLSKRSFDSGAENLDFTRSTESENVINEWVDKETNGKIKNLLSPGTIDSDTSAILVNAIYFKGLWESPFPHINTRKMDFHSASGKTTPADFMYDDDYFLFGAVNDLDATAVELKYRDGNYSMVIVLPNEQHGLEKLAEKVKNNYNLLSISNKLSSKKIDIYIPKFEIEHELDLNQPLEKLGIKTMFSNGANFRDLFKDSAPRVKISKAVHKAVIKVDEAGTEAAAATYLKAYPMSLSLDQKLFRANHPFLWFIKDNNNVYFMGQLTSI